MTYSQTKKQNADYQTTLKPVPTSDRLNVMDVLRGFALFGIIFMNIEWFNRPIVELGQFDPSLTGIDYAASWFVKIFIEGKFYKLFSILFGMGFAVTLLRARESGRPFCSWFVRRMVILFSLGMVHMVLLWEGDIIHDYAAAGLIFLGWIKLTEYKSMEKYQQEKYFLHIGLTILALPIILPLIVVILFGTIGDVDKSIDGQIHSSEITQSVERDKKSQLEIDALTQDSYYIATKYRIKAAIKELNKTIFMSLFILFPLFMIGYWFIVSDVLKFPDKHITLFKNMAWIGISLGLLLSIVGVLPRYHTVVNNRAEIIAIADLVYYLGQYILTAGYLGTIVLMMQYKKSTIILHRLAPMGRMALTNYILQSIILSSIFYGYGFGMYGLISRAPQLLLAMAIILTQLLISRWWLMKFRYGPLEWIWRSLTYLKPQPMLVK